MNLDISLILFASAHLHLATAAISQQQFNSAVTKSGFRAPSTEVYQIFVDQTKDFPLDEAAMFLAQLIRESVGFQFTEELLCKSGNKCDGKYVDSVGLPGKKYHGRGYIQLTCGRNYEAASRALGLGNRLLQNPEQVATDKKLGMQVSVWFWKTKVRPRLAAKKDQFGVTTRAINGGECTVAKYRSRAEKRWKIYLNVAEALKVANKAKETGCYN